MTTPRNRTSARQAAARQRIAQRDSPAGSDPPDEQRTLRWMVNPTKTAEKELIVIMVAYLRDDPTVNDDLHVLRFICRGWYTLERTLHSRAAMDTVKRRLLALGIRSIHRTPDQQWYYWTEYTPLAMMDFSPATTELVDTPPPRCWQPRQHRPRNEKLLHYAPPRLSRVPRNNPSLPVRTIRYWRQCQRPHQEIAHPSPARGLLILAVVPQALHHRQRTLVRKMK